MRYHGIIAFAAGVIPLTVTALRAGPPARIDSLESAYAAAAAGYDSTALRTTAEALTALADANQAQPAVLLTLGLAWWRLELIAYCTDDRKGIGRCGAKALDWLTRAEAAGADPYLAAGTRALACQLLAVTGIAKAAVYGPRAARESKKAAAANPRGYFTRLVAAVNSLQAPKFAGGDPAKAVGQLESMARDFPDSIDVRIHLAAAYRTTGRTDDARRTITPILNAHPANLLARKVAGER